MFITVQDYLERIAPLPHLLYNDVVHKKVNKSLLSAYNNPTDLVSRM